MDDALPISTRALLTMLRREGGWWTVSQLEHHWRPTWSQGEVTLHLATLRRAGYVVCRASLGRLDRPSYSAQLCPTALSPVTCLVSTERHAHV